MPWDNANYAIQFFFHAVDWDGDGKRDIWETKVDVFASTAITSQKLVGVTI